jgi:hypothetical protein
LGLDQRSPSIVLFVPAWWVLFHLLVILYEEPVLRSKFGRDYEAYCRRTPRWIPRLTLAKTIATARQSSGEASQARRGIMLEKQ